MDALAVKLIDKFGPTDGVTITRTLPADYDPIAGTDTPNAPVVSSGVNAAPPVPVTKRMIDGVSAVIEGDYVSYVAQAEYQFVDGDINSLDLEFPGLGKYRLVWQRPYFAGTNPSMTEIFLRRV
jgi:hypothetical protein